MNNARRVVKVGSLQESDAGKAKSQDPYSIYGNQVPHVVPGSKQYWKTFGLDLVAFVQQRGLPDFFVTLTAFDGWPHVQTALARGWGAIPNKHDIENLARKIEDCQPVGSHPEYSVIAAEKHFLWVMDTLRSENGPLGTVETMFGKRSIRKGAVHWHMLLWVKPGTAPNHAIMAELPRGSDPTDKTCLSKKACDANDAA